MKNYTLENIKSELRLKIFIITLSDRASKGIYEDTSGKYIVEQLQAYFSERAWKYDVFYSVIPDSKDDLLAALNNAKSENANIIFTTGGTGVGPRDITPDTVKPLLTKELPGIMELIRVKYGMTIPNAVLSRGVAGFINDAQIYTLPGSLKAVKDFLKEILNTLEHLIFMYYGIDTHKKI